MIAGAYTSVQQYHCIFLLFWIKDSEGWCMFLIVSCLQAAYTCRSVLVKFKSCMFTL